MNPLVSESWLRRHLTDPSLRIVDCRYTLGDPHGGRRAYVAGHIPGASFMDLDRDLAGPPSGARHPLPDPEDFAASARRAGIGDDSLVIAYDQDMTGGAARLWWLLRHVGHDRVAVLDGGYAAWSEPVEVGTVRLPLGDLRIRLRAGDTVDAEELAQGLGRPGLCVVDARVARRYRGDEEPIDRVAGHIPGAVNLPFTTAFPPPGELVAADEVVVYCGSGVTATVVVLALAAAGRNDARLYPGSWSDWVCRSLPVASGPEARF